MGKVFEDYLSEIQKEMLSVCLEYAGHKVDRVFVYASYENNVISSDFFFEVNHKIWEKNRLKDIDQTIYDSSVKRQFACLDELERDIEGIISFPVRHIHDISGQSFLDGKTKLPEYPHQRRHQVPLYRADSFPAHSKASPVKRQHRPAQ